MLGELEDLKPQFSEDEWKHFERALGAAETTERMQEVTNELWLKDFVIMPSGKVWIKDKGKELQECPECNVLMREAPDIIGVFYICDKCNHCFKEKK